MCFSTLARRTTPTTRDYNSNLDGPRNQENAILWALKQARTGRTVDQLRDVIHTVTNAASQVPTPSIRRAISVLRDLGYNITVRNSVYSLVA